MSKKNQSPLSEGEEVLLMKLFDGQCGFLEKGKAQRLADSSQRAEEYLATLRSASKGTQALAERKGKVDLWSNISRRIESEEHAALFLGKRDTHLAPTFSERMSSFFSNSWNVGISGAVMAGLALF